MVSPRGQVIRQAAVGARVAVIRLLAEEAETRVGSVVTDDNDIVALGRRRPKSEHATRREEPLVDDPVEQALCVVVELARRRLVEDLREAALQLPRVEEELPVDVVAQRREVGLDNAAARELRHRKVGETDLVPVGAGLGERQQRFPLLLRVQVAQPVLLRTVVRVERLAPRRIEQRRDDPHHPRGVEHVHDGLRVRRRDPYRRVLA